MYQVSTISYQLSDISDGGSVLRSRGRRLTERCPPPLLPLRSVLGRSQQPRRGDRVALALAVVFVFVVKGKGGGGGGGPFAIRVTRLMHSPASTTLPPAFVPDVVPVGSPGEKRLVVQPARAWKY